MTPYDTDMTIFILTVIAAIAALAGGYTAIKNKHRLHVAMSLTSGLVLGLLAFDLLPEVFEGAEVTGLDPMWPMAAFVAGFLIFHFIEKFILVHEGHESEYGPHRHPRLGFSRAIALVGHSFLDGLSIGVAFQVSPEVGYAVALAVIGHRFADGFDTASFMLLNKNKIVHIQKFLGVVVIMPIIGGLLSLVYTLSESALTIYLGFFAGLLMYIAAGNILPQAHTKSNSVKSLALTLTGVVFIFIITRLA